jgi:ADP-dependent NAD(P)H-hydrate dehydratase / NAD(P)H-hydrate epimerase
LKIVSADQMREIERQTMAADIAGIALMENAAHRVVEELVRTFDPLPAQNIVILCGKGNNGGDGLAIARILRDHNVERVRVVLAADPQEYTGDAKTNLDRLREARLFPELNIPTKLRERREVTLVIDALLGIGAHGPAQGRVAELIAATREFPLAKIVAVDLPSGLGTGGDVVHADITVTFTAPKIEHYLAEGADQHVGRLVLTQVGCPPWLIPAGLEVTEPSDFSPLFAPRKRDGHKGDYGHVLVVGGAPGKGGAVAMSGLAALRAGAGLVTVASSATASFAPELMAESLDGFTCERKSVVAIGPGLGLNQPLVERVLRDAEGPVVIDADGLNSLAGTAFQGRGISTILTPHPGEMARLLGVDRIDDRLATARAFAQQHNVCLVLKGHRTLVAAPSGNEVWINTTGTPGMATAGSGDILTGMIAALVAQFPHDILTAVRAAVWLHGRAAELGVAELTETCLIATDILRYLPQAIRQLAPNLPA